MRWDTPMPALLRNMRGNNGVRTHFPLIVPDVIAQEIFDGLKSGL
jgi:hypothetical protein